jgi:hypothetical protein
VTVKSADPGKAGREPGYDTRGPRMAPAAACQKLQKYNRFAVPAQPERQDFVPR